MTETKKQIQELKKALPGLKEKVFGVAVLLCLSLVMVASVSYAWVTMSTNPELGGVNTTVAANGALEIALSDFDGLEPDQSAAGDSFAAQGQTTHKANTSWGNLVNLSSGYGVDNLVLRPAKLDLTRPNYIYSVKYGQDGRVEGTFSDFGFTTWHQTDKTTNTWKFVAPSNYPDVFLNGDAYGVRAISSVTYEGQEDANVQKLRVLSEDQAVVKGRYENELIGNDKNQSVIQQLVNQYLKHTVDVAVFKIADNRGMGGMVGGDPGPVENLQLKGSTYIPQLTEMMRYFKEDVIEPAGETLAYAASLQSKTGIEYTLEMLLAKDLDRAALLADGVKLTALGYNSTTGKYTTANPYKTLYETATDGLETMLSLWEANGQPKNTFTWGDIDDVVDDLIGIADLKIFDKDGKGYRIRDIETMGGTAAMDLINEKLPKRSEGLILPIVLYKGMLKDFEQLSGASEEFPVAVDVKKSVLIISVSYSGDGRITTAADHNNSYFRLDQELTQTALNAVDNRTLVAADTYGMVLDLWVRTNAESSMLTLNGTPEVVEREEPVTVNIAGHDAPRDVYIYTYYTGQTVEVSGVSVEETKSVEVYEVYHDPDGDGSLTEDYYYYYLSDHKPVYEMELVEYEGEIYSNESDRLLGKNAKDKNGEPALVQKTITEYDVIGFTAANRIWQEDDEDRPLPGVGEISTTQGSGSCYIFHADSEEEYENTKNLLKNLRLVFLDEDGNELSRARLNTDRIFAENGKYTVPIYMESYKETIEDEEGNILATGLCRLTKNEPRRISVLVYLEGENLENDMVMSAESVVGSLNLQFDSTADLHSVGDSDLETEVISLSASIDKNSFEYNGDTQYVQLKAILDGIMPQRVEATFVRMYSATQGTHCEPVALEQGADGYWKADIPFYSPGNYVLKVLSIDGVEYPLPETIQVTVSGFEISAAMFDTSAVLTVDQQTTKRVTVQLAGDVLPQTVVAQFVSESADGGKEFVNVKLNRAGVNWTGDAVFTKSGQYTLTYLLMDGEPYSVPEGMQKSFMAYLGLTADVVLERYEKDANGNYITDENGNKVIAPLNYEFTGEEEVYAFVRVYDDAGVPMDTLGTVTLYYKTYGSAIAENGFGADLLWNGTDYAGILKADRPGRFVFGKLQLNTDNSQQINIARSAPELTIISTVPPSATSLGDAALTYENGTPYYNIRLENAATANSWIVLSDGSQDYTVQLAPTSENSYRAAFPDLDGDAGNGVINANGDWTVKTVLFDNVYANGTFYEAGGEKYEIDIADENHTVVNYLTVTTQSLQLGGTSLENATGGFMQAQSLKNAGLSVTVKAPIGKLDSTKYMSASTYADRLTDATVSLKHDQTTTLTYGGYTATKMGDQSKSPTLSNKVVGTDTVTFTLATDTELRAAGKYALSATVKLDGKDYVSGSGNQVEVYSKPVSVAIQSGYFASANGNAATVNGTSITVYGKKTTASNGCGGSTTTYEAAYVTLSLNNRGDTSFAAELTFNKSGAGVISSGSNTAEGSNYIWAANGGNDAVRYIGQLAGNEETYTAAGELKSQKLILTADGITCEFDVTYVTINNAG